MFFKKKQFLIIFCFTLLAVGLFFYYFITKVENKPVFTPRESRTAEKQKTFLPDFFSLSKLLQAEKASFIEANLAEMRVSFYQGGKLQKGARILKRGDEYFWGGTATGIYQVRSGYKNAFSAITEVYMPYAMNFYGKYYLHGEPYYPSGEKMISEASGGCLQVKDEVAKEFFEKSEVGMPFLVIDKVNDGFEYPLATTKEPSLTSKSFLVADLGSGEILLEKSSLEKKQIASLTKLMTAIIVAENVDLRKKIAVKEEMTELGYGETEAVKAGDYLGVVELFHPLLIESSNDAAEVLASFLGRKRTINLMNEKAKAILMPNTTFACPSGYSEENISTAQDLFYLARYVLNTRPLLFDISKSKAVPGFGGVPFEVNKLWNKNVFSQDETFIGGKTGYIKTSGYNGLFVFKFKTSQGEERSLVFILLDTPRLDEVKSNTQKLYLWVRDNYFN